MNKVSVIVPVYNVEKYLRKCLDSVVSQTLKEIEIICVDDGSTDGSGAILDDYATRDARVSVIHQANAGAGAARNVGMAQATGEYLYFCDPDDWCDRRWLAKLYAGAQRACADVLIAPAFRCDWKSEKTVSIVRLNGWPSGVFDGLAMGPMLFCLGGQTVWNRFFRRAFIQENDIQFQKIPCFNDIVFCDLAMACAKRIFCIHFPGYFYRRSRQGSLQSGKSRTPEVALQAMDGLREGLERRGLFGKYREAFAMSLFKHGITLMFCSADSRIYRHFYEEFVMRMREFPIPDLTNLRFKRRTKSIAGAFRCDRSADDFAVLVAGQQYTEFPMAPSCVTKRTFRKIWNVIWDGLFRKQRV